MYIWGVHTIVQLLDAHLGNGTGHRTVTMVAPLVLTSGPVRCASQLSDKPSKVRGWYQLVTAHTHGDFIVLPHWDIRPPAP